MGIISRLLIPRSVRRAAHPVRTARRAVTPRPIKQARRAIFVATNPLEALEGAAENMVVDALRPKPRRRPRARPAGSYAGGGHAQSAYLTQRELAAIERDRRLDERERTYERAKREEQALVDVHRLPIAIAQRRVVPDPAPVDRSVLEREVGAELRLDELEAGLGRPTQRPEALEPEPVDTNELRRRTESKLLSGVPWYRRSERKQRRAEASAQAAALAEQIVAERQRTHDQEQERLDSLWNELLQRRQQVGDEVDRRAAIEQERRRIDHAQEQKRIDTEWAALLQNDEHLAHQAIDAGLGAAKSKARVARWNRGKPILTLDLPAVDIVPERKPTTTAAGTYTFRDRTKTEINDLYLEMVGSRVIAAARAAFAAAPALPEVSILGTRGAGADRAAYYFGAFQRQGIGGMSGPGLLVASLALGDATGARINLRGRTRELSPIVLPSDPALEEVAVEQGLHVERPSRKPGSAKRNVSESDAASLQRTELPAPATLKFSDDPDEQARLEAAYALSTFPADQARRYALERLNSLDFDIRSRALFFLEELADPTLVGALGGRLSDPEAYLRQRAVRALRRIGRGA